MDLQLGLSLPSFHCSDDHDDDDADLFTPFPVSRRHKRTFSDLRDEDVLLPTLPLLPLTPSHEPDPDDDHLHTSSSTVTRRDGDDGGESAAVGWPPLMYQRKKLRFEEDGCLMVRDNNRRHKSGTTSEEPLRECNNALYVKVKMEGDGIGRKVDLSLHHSFQKLKQTLISMFGRCHEHSECYQLAYQDREGDWLLAEDLPWKNFLQCAQRLKLVKRTC